LGSAYLGFFKNKSKLKIFNLCVKLQYATSNTPTNEVIYIIINIYLLKLFYPSQISKMPLPNETENATF
jgi:hypothetical protein